MSLSVVIPSKRVENLIPCIEAIRKHEPKLRIIVVNDGLDLGRIANQEKCFLCANDPVELVPGVRPFVYARNINIGIRAAGTDDVILMNDDALLETAGGFTAMQAAAGGMGVVSAVTNLAGNPEQGPRGQGLRDAGANMVAFVCALIPRFTINRVGLLDERFTAYGYDDDDYCRRVRDAGLRVGIFDGCYVDHGSLTSTFRGNPRTPANLTEGAAIYQAKWGDGPRIFGMLRVKNEARWIDRVIKSIQPACSRILVLDDHSEDDTAEICERMGCVVYRSTFEGIHEGRDKDFLLGKVWESGARIGDCCLMVDGDEALYEMDLGALLAATQRTNEVCWSTHIVYLWDREDQVRVDRWYREFRRPSLFRLTSRDLRFQSTDCGGNFHCSSAPAQLLGKRVPIPVRLLHYGYLHREDRVRKYEWYNSVDPNNQYEDGYRHMVIGDVFPASSVFLHAGPLQLEALC